MTDEPEVLLLSGRRVTEAFYEWVSGLLARGHTIVVDADGHVSVTPECNSDLLWCLSASYISTKAVLKELLGARHGPLKPRAAQTVRVSVRGRMVGRLESGACRAVVSQPGHHARPA